jgi:hypothetical protein
MPDVLADLIARARSINERMEAELKELCKNPSNIAIAQVIVDRLMKDLRFLHNFNRSEEAFDRLQTRLENTFFLLTGQQYIHESNRTNTVWDKKEEAYHSEDCV